MKGEKMKVLYYLIGTFAILYLFVLFYENKREKEFLKQDLQQESINFVNSLQDQTSENILMKKEANIQAAQKYGTTILDELGNTMQGELKQAEDDVKGAVPLRKN